jgi:hypothetical protein
MGELLIKVMSEAREWSHSLHLHRPTSLCIIGLKLSKAHDAQKTIDKFEDIEE